MRDKDLGNAVRIDREVMPFEWFVSGQNNILASVLDITKFRNRVNRAIRDGDEPIARLFENKWENIEPAFKKLLDNHRNNLPGETGLGAEPRDVLNALIGIGTAQNSARNPYNGRYGKDSAIERFRLDRINDSVKSGRQGFQFDYPKAAGNALPEIPTPLPDLSRDLPTGQAMPDVKMPDGRIVDAWSKIKDGDNWNSVKQFLPSDDVAPPALLIGRSKDEVVENAARFLAETKSAVDRKGIRVLLSNPQTRGGYSDNLKNRAEHAIGRELKKGSSVRELDPDKAAWMAAVPDTIQNAPVKVHAGSEVLYFRKYRKKTHMVVTSKEGVFLDQEPFDSGFVTQYPLELRDRQFKGVAKVEILPPPAAVSGSPTNAATNATPATTDAVNQEGSVGTPGNANISGVSSESRQQAKTMR